MPPGTGFTEYNYPEDGFGYSAPPLGGDFQKPIDQLNGAKWYMPF